MCRDSVGDGPMIRKGPSWRGSRSGADGSSQSPQRPTRRVSTMTSFLSTEHLCPVPWHLYPWSTRPSHVDRLDTSRSDPSSLGTMGGRGDDDASGVLPSNNHESSGEGAPTIGFIVDASEPVWLVLSTTGLTTWSPESRPWAHRPVILCEFPESRYRQMIGRHGE